MKLIAFKYLRNFILEWLILRRGLKMIKKINFHPNWTPDPNQTHAQKSILCCVQYTIDFQLDRAHFMKLKQSHWLFHFHNYCVVDININVCHTHTHYSLVFRLLYFRVHWSIFNCIVWKSIQFSSVHHSRTSFICTFALNDEYFSHLFLNTCCWCCFFFSFLFVEFSYQTYCWVVMCIVWSVVNMIYGVTFMSIAHSIYAEDATNKPKDSPWRTDKFFLSKSCKLKWYSYHTHACVGAPACTQWRK